MWGLVRTLVSARDVDGYRCAEPIPTGFARIHRSRIVRIAAVTEIETLESGQYLFRLASGTRLGSGPAYRERIRQAFGLRGA